MGFEPQKFFIGVIDFFAILMPGALLTFLFKDEVGRAVLRENYPNAIGDGGWAAFLFVSYLVGHLLHLLGAIILDKFYDKLLDGARRDQVGRLAEGKGLASGDDRPIAADIVNLFKGGNDPLPQARRIHDLYLDRIGAASAVNTFQWSKAQLALKSPEALSTVQRFEADSKFFRSFSVALCIIVLASGWISLDPHPHTPAGSVLGALPGDRNWLTIAAAITLPFALWRFAEQRVKATYQAYWFIIAMEANAANTTDIRPPTHAGGVVWRDQDGRRKYLMVQSSSEPRVWVLPKGHVGNGESARVAAVREVREETGIWASVESELDVLSYWAGGTPIQVQYFLMRYRVDDGAGAGEPGRGRQWFPLEEAIMCSPHEETQDLLKSVADRERLKPPRSAG